MQKIQWDSGKNEKLKKERGISFEEVAVCIEYKQVLAIIEAPGKKHKGQKVLIVILNNYVYYVPFVKYNQGIFLKTIIPSRKLTRKYLKRR